MLPPACERSNDIDMESSTCYNGSMTKEQAIQRIDMEFMDSGNGHYNFLTAESFLPDAYYEAKSAGDGYVFVKPPSGSEMEIPIEWLDAAYDY